MFKQLALTVIIFAASVKNLNVVPSKHEDPTLQVKLPQGIVQGERKVTSGKRQTYYSFRGIPYAQPPVGNLRFKAPLVAQNWSGILDGRHQSNDCMQKVSVTVPNVSEDCLYINVYTAQEPQKQKSKLLPVMVYVFGGAFEFGTSNPYIYNPDYLINHGVILAIFNHRIGVFGYLSTEDMASPGNYGLKDQLEALRWVKRNIRYFGGDPSSITVFGESSGAALVSYLVLSPLSKGLFHRAISQSGTVLTGWAFQRNPKKVARRIGALLGIFEIRTDKLVETLRTVDSETLVNVARTCFTVSTGVQQKEGLAPAPTIEPKHDGAVLTEGSYELLTSGKFNKVTYMLGFTAQEMEETLKRLNSGFRVLMTSWEVIPSLYVPNNMNIEDFATRTEVGKTIAAFYSPSGILKIDPNESVYNYMSDTGFVRPIRKTAQLHSKFAKTYLYRFSYNGNLQFGQTGIIPIRKSEDGVYIFSTLQEMVDNLGCLNQVLCVITRAEIPGFTSLRRSLILGVGHTADLCYLFKAVGNEPTYSDDILMAEKMSRMWTNFAKYGTPTPKKDAVLDNVIWSPLSASPKHPVPYMDINITLRMSANPREEAMTLWENLYQAYAKPPYTTY